MKFSTVALSALSLFTSLAVASPLSKRDCASIPSFANEDVIRKVYQTSMGRGVTEKVMLATFATCWVESHCHSLPCGDQDSVGVFQQRPSQGWGTVDQIMDVEYSTHKFLDVCIPTAEQHPDQAAGTIAQMVQRSEYPDRYNEQMGKAEELLARARTL